MGIITKDRLYLLVLITACATAVAATEGSGPEGGDLPDEALALYEDLVAMKFDAAPHRSTSPTATPPHRAWSSHTTPNFVLLTDAQQAWSREAGRMLERTREAFYRSFRAAGFRPADLGDRLVWVAFQRREEFNRYALSVDRLDMSWSDGYYSTRTNRVALVCEWEEPHEESVHVGGSDSGKVCPNPRPGFANLSQTTHEAAHQMAFNSGIQKRGVMYPLWASEGLATSFEAGEGDTLGPDSDNAHRREQLLDAADRGELLPLEAFATLTRVPVSDPQATHDVYAQSWAFFQFLFTHRPRELRDYLANLSGLELGRRDPRTMRREFTDAFGPLDELDRSWRAYLRLVRRPEAPAMAADR